MTLPTYIPVAEAAEKYGYDLDELKKMARSGKINAAVLPDGDMVVSDESIKAKILKKEDLPEYKKFANLAQEVTWTSKAVRDYGISHPTIKRWVELGFINKMGKEGNKVLLNAQDMAYCAEIYELRKGRQGQRIFAEDGTPYVPKTGPLPSEPKQPKSASEEKALAARKSKSKKMPIAA